MDRIPPLREFLCSDSDTREILREVREIFVIGPAASAARLRGELRRFGYRVRVSEVADFDEHEPVDVLVLLAIPDGLPLVLSNAARRGCSVLWLGREAGDPSHAWAAHRAGFDVIFHRDPAEEYRMHFDDLELGHVNPGASRDSE